MKLLNGFLLLAAVTQAAPLETYPNARYVEAEYNDGDSFRITFDDQEQVARLYYVDCPESHVSPGSKSDLQRLREQSRYFGCPDLPAVKQKGEEAAHRVKELLAEPFQVHTAGALALGRSRKSRIYVMITLADGRDLAQVLVQNGLARSVGIARARPDGTPAKDYKEQLKDHEFAAALDRRGVWKYSDPEKIAAMREAERAEQRALQGLAFGAFANISEDRPLDLNSASMEQLQQLDGIGPILAERIVEARPFKHVDELQQVKGIGPEFMKRCRTFLRIGEK